MPTKNELAKFSIRGAVTETAANTFTQSTVNTNIQVQGNEIFICTGIWFRTDADMAADQDQMQMQLTYTSQSALVTPDDPDWLYGWHWRMVMTTSGVSVFNPIVHQDLGFFPMANPQLYFACQGTSLAAASSCQFKLEGYLQKVSTTDFFRIQRVR